ncbi:MAG TPA: hypothetical protein VFI20_11040, partial [Terracidiphilus sp.]|nr:hypothetical protein [Terracidiphilus sp.]
GEEGGRLVGEGRPVKIAAIPGSHTGKFLARYYASGNGVLTAAGHCDWVEESGPAPTIDTAEMKQKSALPARKPSAGRPASRKKKLVQP